MIFLAPGLPHPGEGPDQNGILTNPKSKSKVQVQVQADDWVFFKIEFSNHPVTRESFKEAKIELYFQNKSC